MIKTTYRVKLPTKRFKSKQQMDECKRSVRKSKEWKELKEYVYERQEGKDAITGKPLKRGWALHHLSMNPDEYDNLGPERFIAVSPTSHQLIHTLFDLRNNIDWQQLQSLVKLMEQLTNEGD